MVHVSFGRALTAYMPQYLDAALHHLKVTYDAYQHCYILADVASPGSSEDEAVELPQLICPIFDFLSNVIRGGKAKEWLSPQNLTALMEQIFQYSQMTAEDVGDSIFV